MESTTEWRPVADHEGIYEVSNTGRVRSLDRLTADGRNIRGRILKHGKLPTGHEYVNLCKQGKCVTTYVHRLVAKTFIGEPPEGTECCHNDGDPSNNNVENLRWGTPLENVADRQKHGRWQPTPRQDFCMRGHRMSGANVDVYAPNKTRKVELRACRACARARAYARYHSVEMTQELADEFFRGEHDRAA